jgi:hypothetical protein
MLNTVVYQELKKRYVKMRKPLHVHAKYSAISNNLENVHR